MSGFYGNDNDGYFEGLMGFASKLKKLVKRRAKVVKKIARRTPAGQVISKVAAVAVKRQQQQAVKQAKADAIAKARADEITALAISLAIPQDQLVSLQQGLGSAGLLRRLRTLAKLKANKQYAALKNGVTAMSTGDPAAVAAVVPESATPVYPSAAPPATAYPDATAMPYGTSAAYAPAAAGASVSQPLPVNYPASQYQYPTPDETTVAVDAQGQVMLAEEASPEGLAPVEFPDSAAPIPAPVAETAPEEAVQMAVEATGGGEAIGPAGMVVEEAQAQQLEPGTEEDVVSLASRMEEEGVPTEFAEKLSFDVLSGLGLGGLSEAEKDAVAKKTAEVFRKRRRGKLPARRPAAAAEAEPFVSEEAAVEQLEAGTMEDVARLATQLEEEGVPAGFAENLAFNVVQQTGVLTDAEGKAVAAKTALTLGLAEDKPFLKTGLGIAVLVGGGFLAWKAFKK